MSLPELVIKDSNGKVVYLDAHGRIEEAYLFVWRDLLISSIVYRPNKTLTKKLVADIELLGLSDQMLERLEDEITCMSWILQQLHQDPDSLPLRFSSPDETSRIRNERI